MTPELVQLLIAVFGFGVLVQQLRHLIAEQKETNIHLKKINGTVAESAEKIAALQSDSKSQASDIKRLERNG